MSSKTYSPRRADVTIAGALKAATVSPARARSSRRPALIPAASFNALESTEDLSSILPELHGLHNSGGSVYILPPAPPPPNLELRLKLEQHQQRPLPPRQDSIASLATDTLDVDGDGDWTMSGAQTPVPPPPSGALPVTRTGTRRSEGTIAHAMRRWSMKDLVELEGKADEEGRFQTLKQYAHKRESSIVSDDLWSWVNATEAEANLRNAGGGSQGSVQDLDSLSPMSSTHATHPDIQGQLDRLQQASRLLHEL